MGRWVAFKRDLMDRKEKSNVSELVVGGFTKISGGNQVVFFYRHFLVRSFGTEKGNQYAVAKAQIGKSYAKFQFQP